MVQYLAKELETASAEAVLNLMAILCHAKSSTYSLHTVQCPFFFLEVQFALLMDHYCCSYFYNQCVKGCS